MLSREFPARLHVADENKIGEAIQGALRQQDDAEFKATVCEFMGNISARMTAIEKWAGSMDARMTKLQNQWWKVFVYLVLGASAGGGLLKVIG